MINNTNIEVDEVIVIAVDEVFFRLRNLCESWTILHCIFLHAKDALADEQFDDFLEAIGFDEDDAENILSTGPMCGKCIYLRSIQ